MRIPHGVCEVIRALQWTNPGRFSPDSENDKRLLKILNTPLIFAQNINREYINIEPPDDPKQSGKFVAKIKQLSKRLDRRRAIVINA